MVLYMIHPDEVIFQSWERPGHGNPAGISQLVVSSYQTYFLHAWIWDFGDGFIFCSGIQQHYVWFYHGTHVCSNLSKQCMFWFPTFVGMHDLGVSHKKHLYKYIHAFSTRLYSYPTTWECNSYPYPPTLWFTTPLPGCSKPLVSVHEVKVKTPSPNLDHPRRFNTHTCTLLILPITWGICFSFLAMGLIALPTWNLGVSVEKITWYLGEQVCLLAMIHHHLGDILSFVAAFLFGPLKQTKILRSNNSLLTL